MKHIMVVYYQIDNGGCSWHGAIIGRIPLDDALEENKAQLNANGCRRSMCVNKTAKKHTRKNVKRDINII